MVKFKFFLSLFLLPLIALGQGEIANFSTTFQDNFSLGIGLKSNGLKLFYRRGYYINIFERYYYEFGLSKIKDEREIKFSNPYYISTQDIYFAKVNDCFDLRVGYGRLKVLTQKQDRGSVEIRFHNSIGVTIAFLKPVYYTVMDKTATYLYDTKFTEDLLLQQIVEMAPYYKGLDELKIIPGGYVNIGISFEHSKKESLISALEVGATLSGYLARIKTIYGDRGKRIIYNFYIQYYFGQYFSSLKRHGEQQNPENQQ